MVTAKPPAVGKHAGARVDTQLHADLSIIMRTGASTTEAIRWAVEQGAAALYNAWSSGACPVGMIPVITGWEYTPHKSVQQPEGER